MNATIQKAIEWVQRLIEKQLFSIDSAKIQLAMNTCGPKSERSKKHYVQVELDFIEKWADKRDAEDLANTLRRPSEGIRAKIRRG